ncbi:MAG: hypothetical protein HW390_286 [Candidatus Brocadiaceae bacterium]|nr:hypothetical protein [Candidatus Brocadiaceae bacterium]
MTNKIELNAQYNCIFEVVADITIHENLVLTYIILPITLDGIAYRENRTLLIKLARNKNKSLIVSSRVSKLDIDIQSLILTIERVQSSLPRWE